MESGPVERVGPSTPTVPSGTVTFLFSDIEGSTVRWERYPDEMRDAVRDHDALVRAAVERREGHVFKTIGDAFCVAFRRPRDAVGAALDVQRALAAHDFSGVDGVRVRMAIHLGVCDERDGDYFGAPLNRVARLIATAHGGQVVLSNVASEIVRSTLPEGAALLDLGEHRLKDLTQPERVFQLTASDLPETFPPLHSLSVFRNNLPLQLTPLLGRDAVVEDVVRAVREARLVTLLGAGGIGKTRIALQAGAELSDGRADGVWFVDLASLTAGSFVAETIAATLDLPPVGGRSAFESVLQHLRSRTLLLVLDNCEHVIGEASRLAQTLAASAPGVRVLATSREPLGIAGERIVRVPSLEVPPSDPPPSAETALRYGAVALFVARARASDARFALTDATAPTVADIVRRLDGIALAIELAAARVAVLGATNLARRLDERFRVLTGGSRTALPRQRTMRALIDWSWELLSEIEQIVLRRAAIFSGGWTVDAAESVCAGGSIDAFDVLDTVVSLVDKSLVTSETDTTVSRTRLLETTRAYALEKLEDSGERDAVALVHAEWAAAFCDRMHSSYDASAAWFATMEAELDNARAALRWSIDRNRADVAARIVLRALCGYWWYRAPGEGLAWTEQIIARLDVVTETLLVGAMHGIAGGYTVGQRKVVEFGRAVELLAPLVEAGVDLAPHTSLTYCLGGLSAALLAQGDVARARDAVERCLALYRTTGTTKSRGYANALANLGSALAAGGGSAEARMRFEEARALFIALGETPGVAMVALAEAEAEFAAGDIPAARSAAREAASINDERDLSVGAAEAFGALAACALVLGDFGEASLRAFDALERAASARIEAPPSALLTVALLALERGDAASAARVLGFVDALERREERRLDAAAATLRKRLLPRIAETLEASAFRVLHDEGAALGAEDAFQAARIALAPERLRA